MATGQHRQEVHPLCCKNVAFHSIICEHRPPGEQQPGGQRYRVFVTMDCCFTLSDTIEFAHGGADRLMLSVQLHCL